METIIKSTEQVKEKLTGVKFKTESLKTKKFVAITEPGLYLLTCLSNVTEANKIEVAPEDGENFESFEKYIMNLNAFFPDQLPTILGGLKNEDGSVKTEIPVEHTKGWFATGNRVVNKRRPDMDLPMAGQQVKCVVDWVEPKDRPGVQLLRIRTVQVVAAKKGKTIDLTSFFAGTEEAQAVKSESEETLLQVK